MGLKLDKQKAYDKVEWSFVLKVLELYGFRKEFLGWIQQCMEIVSF